jgi:hypothetical protein
MKASRELKLGVIAAFALAVVGVVTLAQSGDERRIRASLAELELALRSRPGEEPRARAQRIERAFEREVAEDVRVNIPDLPSIGRGRRELADAAIRAGEDPRGVALEVHGAEVRLDEERRAAAVTLRAVLGRPGDELHKDERSVALRYELGAAGWKIGAILVSPEARAEPEARP